MSAGLQQVRGYAPQVSVREQWGLAQALQQQQVLDERLALARVLQVQRQAFQRVWHVCAGRSWTCRCDAGWSETAKLLSTAGNTWHPFRGAANTRAHKHAPAAVDVLVYRKRGGRKFSWA